MSEPSKNLSSLFQQTNFIVFERVLIKKKSYSAVASDLCFDKYIAHAKSQFQFHFPVAQNQ